MQGIPFALEAFALGLALLDLMLFHGHYLLTMWSWLS